MSSLYENIQQLCAAKGIRPGRLCDELGISRGLMTDLKMGRKKSVSAETAQKIAAFFGWVRTLPRQTFWSRWMWLFTVILRN